MRPRHEIPAERIIAVLSANKGSVEDAASSFGVSPRTLYRRMAEYGIKKPRVSYQLEAA